MQTKDENRKLLGDLDGIDILLQQLAVSLVKLLFFKAKQTDLTSLFEVLQKAQPWFSWGAGIHGEFV